MKYQLNQWIFDTQARTLQCRHTTRTLPPKPFRLLQLLLQSEGRMVDKACIRSAVWPGRVISETTLYKCIERLRGLLDEDASRPMIQTLHGEGYRLLGARPLRPWLQRWFGQTATG